jgi:hypothetical protein
MTESFGMQLDDDSLLALYCVYDPQVRGCTLERCQPLEVPASPAHQLFFCKARLLATRVHLTATSSWRVPASPCGRQAVAPAPG